MQEIEKEFKWDASARGAFARFEKALSAVCGGLPPAQKWQITDRYLDNAAGDFFRRKIALRVRCQSGRFEATLKSKTALQNGLASRQEHTLALPEAHRFAQALQSLQARQEWHGLPMQNLSVRFMIKNRRTTYTFTYGRVRCEAALDRYVIYASQKHLAKREIELELKSGAEEDFIFLTQHLSRQSGLAPCAQSKVASAEALLNA